MWLAENWRPSSWTKEWRWWADGWVWHPQDMGVAQRLVVARPMFLVLDRMLCRQFGRELLACWQHGMLVIPRPRRSSHDAGSKSTRRQRGCPANLAFKANAEAAPRRAKGYNLERLTVSAEETPIPPPKTIYLWSHSSKMPWVTNPTWVVISQQISMSSTRSWAALAKRWPVIEEHRDIAKLRLDEKPCTRPHLWDDQSTKRLGPTV